MSLKVEIVTQDDPFYIPIFFNSFFQNLNENIEITRVTILDPKGDSTSKFLKRLLNFYGLKNFTRLGLRYAFRKLKITLSLGEYSAGYVTKKFDVKTSYLTTVNSKEFINHINKNNIDVILSVSSPEIFKPPLLKAPKWGCINVHTAKLPKYRGLLPTFWALYHGDKEIGITVHTMEEKVDKGKIVLQKTFPVKRFDTLDDVITRGKRLGGKLAAEALKQIENDNVKLKAMEGESSYHSFPTKKHRKEFQKRGGKLL